MASVRIGGARVTARPPLRRTTTLRQMIERPEMAFILEAHSGVSAKIVEEAGFEGIWASGLTMSAASGVRDNNELSWTQVADQAGLMADAVSIPVLLDGDTGYGNFNNMRRLVRKLEQAGVAGVAIEDKQFPKSNSFLRSERQPLADIDEFSGKIKAGKDSQHDADFVVVARVEALIAGWGMAEALRRAEAYRAAGADAILIHSKQGTPGEIFAFLQEWGGRAPIVLVPTKYYTTPTADFRQRGVSLVIWANHLLRTSVVAMQATARRIREDESVINVEGEVAPLQEVFRLQGDHELERAEAAYLPEQPNPLQAIVLAAAPGSGFGDLTSSVPKAMLPVRGRPILSRLIDELEQFGCRATTIVRGYRPEAVEAPGARFVENPDYRDTSEAYSLSLAEASLRGATIVSFGDIVVKRHVIHSLLEEIEDGIAILVDSKLAGAGQPNSVSCDRPYTGRFMFDRVRLRSIGPGVEGAGDGVWIGLLYAGASGAQWLRDAIARAREDGALRRETIADLLTRIMAAGHPVHVVYTHGGWINVNDMADLIDAASL